MGHGRPVSADEACQILGVRSATLLRLIANGTIQTTSLPHGRYVDGESLDALRSRWAAQPAWKRRVKSALRWVTYLP